MLGSRRVTYCWNGCGRNRVTIWGASSEERKDLDHHCWLILPSSRCWIFPAGRSCARRSRHKGTNVRAPALLRLPHRHGAVVRCIPKNSSASVGSCVKHPTAPGRRFGKIGCAGAEGKGTLGAQELSRLSLTSHRARRQQEHSMLHKGQFIAGTRSCAPCCPLTAVGWQGMEAISGSWLLHQGQELLPHSVLAPQRSGTIDPVSSRAKSWYYPPLASRLSLEIKAELHL